MGLVSRVSSIVLKKRIKRLQYVYKKNSYKKKIAKVSIEEINAIEKLMDADNY